RSSARSLGQLRGGGGQTRGRRAHRRRAGASHHAGGREPCDPQAPERAQGLVPVDGPGSGRDRHGLRRYHAPRPAGRLSAAAGRPGRGRPGRDRQRNPHLEDPPARRAARAAAGGGGSGAAGAAGLTGPRRSGPGPAPAGQRGTLRRFDRARSSMRPTPPSSTVRVAASAKPLTCSPVIEGGRESALGSVRTSTSEGPRWFSAAVSAPRTSSGSVTVVAWTPDPPAMVAKSAWAWSVPK